MKLQEVRVRVPGQELNLGRDLRLLHADQLNSASVKRRGNTDLDLLRQQRGLEVGLDDNLDLEL